MTRLRLVGCAVAMALSLAGTGVGDVIAAVNQASAEETTLVPVEGDGVADVIGGNDAEEAGGEEIHRAGALFAGYRFLGVDRFGGRAAPYEYFHSGVTGGFISTSYGRDRNYSLDGTYLNNDDYLGEFFYDYGGRYRFHLRTEALFHHTEHDLLGPGFSLPTNPPRQYTSIDLDPGDRYGMRVEQDLAQFRYKLKDYPLHVNLGYWRMLKEGSQQLRFADQSFETSVNTIYSRSRAVDREIHEGTLGIDGHFGPVDLVYTFMVRQFNDKTDPPRDLFLTRTAVTPIEHNEDPDSRYLAHTVKIHTSLDGGITGGASYTLAQRENRSRLSDVTGADRTSSTLHNIAGDFTYIPDGRVTVGLKYRRQEVDNSTPPALATTFLTDPVAVRPDFSTVRDVMTTTVAYHPVSLLTVKGEYRAELLHRDLQNFGDETLNWHGLPENSLTQRGSLSLLSRPWKRLRLNAQYSYTAVDHPSYGASPRKRHEGQFLATYSGSATWGVNAGYRAIRDENDGVTRLEISLNPVTYAPAPQFSGRSKATDNVTGSVWFVPVAPVTLSGSYGFLRSSIDQGVMFTTVVSAAAPNPIQDVANYTSQTQFYALTAAFRLTERASLSLALQQVRSFAEFDPRPLVNGTSDTIGIRDLSRIKTVESSLSTRGEYRVGDRITCSLDYSYRDYDEKHSSAFDGAVHVVTASLAGRW